MVLPRIRGPVELEGTPKVIDFNPNEAENWRARHPDKLLSKLLKNF